jgi:hypothetical protein
MHRINISLLMSAMLFCSFSLRGQSVENLDTQRINVVKLRRKRDASSETAAGVYVGKDQKNAFFVTAFHFVQDEKDTGGVVENVELQFYSGTTWVAANVFSRYDGSMDLAVVYVPAVDLPAGIIPIPANDPRVLLSIHIIGHPPSGDWNMWAGTIESETGLQNDERFFSTNTDDSLTKGFSGGAVLDPQGNFIGMHQATESKVGKNLKSGAIVAKLRLWNVPTNNISGANTVTSSNDNCSSATAEALELSLKAHLLDRVTQNLGCRPENKSDEQVHLIVADMFDDSSFPKSRDFLEGLWTTPLIASLDLCLLSHHAIYSANFDGLAWIISRTPKNNIQSCDRFDTDLVSALFLVGKDRVPTIVSQLKNAGLSLDHDQYSLFREAYEAYIENAYPGFKWVSDSLAPPTLEAFREAKVRAEAHFASTSPLFTQSSRSSEKAKDEVQKRIAEYCPDNMSYCSDLVKTNPPVERVEPARNRPPVQGEFVDRETGLMWTAKASDNAMDWAKAGEFCVGLRQAGYHDWRLPQLEELLRLYDTSAAMVSGCKGHDGQSYTFHIKKGIDPVCGDVWSGKKSARKLSLGGYTFDYAWLFNFAEGGPTENPTWWLGTADIYHHHVLCVRGSSR